MNYVGLKYMDRHGDMMEVYGYDQETNKYLVKENYSTSQFASEILSEQEINEELKVQEIRLKFYKNCVTLN